MSDKPTPNKKEKKKVVVKKPKMVDETQSVSQEPAQPTPLAPDYPQTQDALPMPPVDKKVVEQVERLIETSYLEYIKELKKRDIKESVDSIHHLNSILSEYLGPYMLIGYMPDSEPIEVLYAPSVKDKEAILERLRKTFIRHMNASMPG